MPANTYGRQVVIAAANKSGGGVVTGDVMVIDTTNNLAFTTTTSASSTLTIGVAQETIANNATGRILLEGYAALVNVQASVTRGHYGATYTVAKQATDAGASRTTGTFCQFLTGGTTPDAIVYPTDLAGVALTNPMTTKGDIIIADTGGTPTRLAAGATAGMVLTSAGSAAFETFSLPPGYELAYVEFTSPVSITATVEASSDIIVSAGSVAFDGSTRVCIEFFTPDLHADPVVGRFVGLWYFDGSTSIGSPAFHYAQVATQENTEPVYVRRFLTPSNASHTYSIRGYVSAGTGSVAAGVGGAGNYVPGYIRITKA